MRRHVTKCTQKMFDSGIDLSIFSQDSSDGNGERDFNTSPVRRILTKEERQQRCTSLKERGKGLRTIMKGNGKRALDDMFLENS